MSSLVFPVAPVGIVAYLGAEWPLLYVALVTFTSSESGDAGGFRIAGMDDKLDLTFDYTRSEGETEILFAGQGVSLAPLPELESTMDSLRLSLRYAVSDRFDTTLDVRWERFESADWALDGVEPATIPTVLTMGADAYDYDVWVVGIGFRYRIGGGEE